MTNIHPHPALTFSQLIQLRANHGLVLQRKQGNRLVFRHQPNAITGPGLQRLSNALQQRAQ